MRWPTVLALVIANLLVALQTARHDWGYYETILIYWCEALIIGGYNVLRLLVVGFGGEQPFGAAVSRWVEFSPGFRILATLVGTGFFAVKFGGFALGVGLLVIALPAFSAPAGTGGRQVLAALSAAVPGVAVSALALVVSHGLSFVRNFVMEREYQRMSLFGLVFWPYVRMSFVATVLALGLILASLLPGLAAATTFAVVMVLVKLAADVVSHLVEHAWIGGRPLREGGPAAQPTGAAPPVPHAPIDSSSPPVVHP